MFPILTQALYLHWMHFSNVFFSCVNHSTPIFWKSLFLASLCFSACIPDYSVRYVLATAKKHHFEVHKMLSMALLRQIKHIQARNSMCTAVQRIPNVHYSKLRNTVTKTKIKKARNCRKKLSCLNNGTMLDIICSLLLLQKSQ